MTIHSATLGRRRPAGTLSPPVAAYRPSVGGIAEALGAGAWRRLSPAIRARFGAEAQARPVKHRGVMGVVRCSWVGCFFAQASRLFGTPLAPGSGRDVPVEVRVFHDRRRDGVTWERCYRFPGRAPVTVASTKCRDASGNFLEVTAGGLGMWLDLYEASGRLCFRSRRYFIEAFGRRWTLPDWMTPGETLVMHGDESAGRFRFTMSIRHPLFGETFFQDGVFETLENEEI